MPPGLMPLYLIGIGVVVALVVILLLLLRPIKGRAPARRFSTSRGHWPAGLEEHSRHAKRGQ